MEHAIVNLVESTKMSGRYDTSIFTSLMSFIAFHKLYGAKRGVSVNFYIFFESVLIPMFLIIGIWGGPKRVYSAFKFFLYTLLGSVLMLVAIISIYWISGTTDVIKL